MSPITTLGQQLQVWFDYLSFCATAAISAPVCRPYWLVVMVCSLTIGLLLIGGAIWKVISYQRKLAAALAAEEQRQAVAPPEVMEQYRWAGDNIEPGAAQASRRPPEFKQ